MGKKYKLRYLKLAQADLLDIASYISGHLHAPQAAARLIDKLDQAISNLQQFPFFRSPYAISISLMMHTGCW